MELGAFPKSPSHIPTPSISGLAGSEGDFRKAMRGCIEGGAREEAIRNRERVAAGGGAAVGMGSTEKSRWHGSARSRRDSIRGGVGGLPASPRMAMYAEDREVRVCRGGNGHSPDEGAVTREEEAPSQRGAPDDVTRVT
jgi:hypothetical protein